MFWILRRTRLTSAVQFFNAINNNNSSNNASTETRPARKEYSKLAGDENEAACTHAHNENNLVMDNAIGDDKNNMVEDSENMHSTDLLDTDTDSSCTDIDFDHDNGHEVFSDDSDYDETLTCNVCDRSFPCHRQLASHKQKKRHFGCSACDSLFPSLMALEHHKEEFEHWSGDEDICTDSEDDSDLTVASEEMERLL